MNFNKAKHILELGNSYTPEQVKQNYHRLSLKFHPDKGGDSEDFVELTNAYNFITNEQPDVPKINLNHIFQTFVKMPFVTSNIHKVNSFFGFKKEINVKITPREFLEGTTKEIEEPYKVKCGCEPQFCDRCRGFSLHNCQKCNGSGITFCGTCINGYITHTKIMFVSIPKNSLKNISLENIVVCLELDSTKKNYFVKDEKLYYRYKISLKESLVGFEKTFKDPFGFEHTIKSNGIIRQNDGYFISSGIYLVFEVVYPKKLNNCVIKQLKSMEF